MRAERWLPVTDWEGLYEVSDAGRLRSLDRLLVLRSGETRRYRGLLRNPFVIKRGYEATSLSRPGCRKTVYIHTLVLIAFSGAPQAGMECRHLNGDPLDNRLENLVWGTSSENKYDLVRHGTHHGVKKTECKYGHPLSGDNIHRRGSSRDCRQCNRDRAKASYWRHKDLNSQKQSA